MTIKQVQAKFTFDVENQKLINQYNIFTGKATSTEFKCVNFDGKPCWTVPIGQSNNGLAYQITFTKELIKLEFDYYIDSIDGFCILFGINIDESTRYHLVNVSKSYPSYGNYVWWNPDRSQISDGILNANTWFHFVIEGTKIQIYNMSGELLYERNKVDNVIQSIELNSDANYTPYIANMVATFNYSQNYLDSIGLTNLWSKIKSLFATKTELASKANDNDVVHKSGDETITGAKTFSSNIVGNLTGNADTATKATTADSATKATQDSDGNQINTTYLPLAGGALTSFFIGRNVDNSYLHLSGCTDYLKGAMLIMYGENYKDWTGGGFRLIARNSSIISELDGYPDGTLTWNGKSVISSNATPGILSFPAIEYIDYSSSVPSGNEVYIEAPADGWFMLNAYCQEKTKFRCATDGVNFGLEVVTGNTGYHTAFCPVQKGKRVALCVTGTYIYCRFFSCQGNV